MGTFTAKGRSVAPRHLRICTRSVSGYIEPEPITPRPPALDTADASSQPEHQIMPACTSGWRIPKSSFTLFVGSIGAKVPGFRRSAERTLGEG